MTFFDATVSHAVNLERYKAGLVRDVLARINGVSQSLYKTLAASDLDQMTRGQLNALLRDIDRAIRDDYVPITEGIEAALNDFGVYEADWTGQQLVRNNLVVSLGMPSEADIWAAINARPFEGKFLKDWIAGLPDATARRVRETVQQGYVDGLGPVEIARNIRGTRTRQGVMDISKRGANAMVRTAVSHTSNVARERTYQSNRAIKQVQWLSVLDFRTSSYCRAQDGKIYDKGDGPRPPAHINCRSTVIPLTSSNRDRLGERQTYGDWLARQPAAKQDEVLGVSKARLFRAGETLDRFVDNSGHEYTLDQLRARDQAKFDEVLGE